jgi:hypothetical protein
MDWTPQTAPRDSKIINALMSPVTHGLDTPNSPYGLRNNERTDVTCYARIQQPKQPLGLRNHQRTDVTGTYGLDSPNSP